MDSIRGRLAALVGRDVCESLDDGTRLDDCQLVFFSRRLTSAWICHRGDDVFVPVDAITDVWDAAERSAPTSGRAGVSDVDGHLVPEDPRDAGLLPMELITTASVTKSCSPTRPVTLSRSS